MNYQYPYNNSYGNRKKSEGTYLVKLSKQLAGVLIIMLVLLFIKYVKNDATSFLNTKIKDILSVDYTVQTKQVFVNGIPNVNNYIGNFFNKLNVTQEFKIDALPVVGKITSQFGKSINAATKKEENHEGINISVKAGTPVKVVFDGTVETVENNKTMGYMLVINHNNGYKTAYGNLSEIKVSEGESVTKGSVVALSGKPGESAAPNLYFEIYKNDKPVNPMDYIKSN